MANLHLVTGYAGVAHVTAADEGSLNSVLYGAESYVLNRGNKFAATTLSNNSIRVADGDIMLQGRHVRLNGGSYVDLAIDNGTQGNYRNDLIVVRYTRNGSTGIEECNLVVIKGTATTGTPTDPDYIQGNIIEDHALTAEFPLYRVPLNGLNVQELVPLFDVLNVSVSEFNTNALPAETNIADGDYFPFYDTSASAHRKTLWSNLLAKIKAALKIDTSNINNSAVTAEKIASGAVSTNYTATIGTGWSGSAAPYSIAVTVTGITANDKPDIDVVPSSTYATAEAQCEAWANVYRAVTSANTITFYAHEKPTVSIPIQIKAVRK